MFYVLCFMFYVLQPNLFLIAESSRFGSLIKVLFDSGFSISLHGLTLESWSFTTPRGISLILNFSGLRTNALFYL